MKIFVAVPRINFTLLVLVYLDSICIHDAKQTKVMGFVNIVTKYNTFQKCFLLLLNKINIIIKYDIIETIRATANKFYLQMSCLPCEHTGQRSVIRDNTHYH